MHIQTHIFLYRKMHGFFCTCAEQKPRGRACALHCTRYIMNTIKSESCFARDKSNKCLQAQSQASLCCLSRREGKEPRQKQ